MEWSDRLKKQFSGRRPWHRVLAGGLWSCVAIVAMWMTFDFVNHSPNDTNIIMDNSDAIPDDSFTFSKLYAMLKKIYDIESRQAAALEEIAVHMRRCSCVKEESGQ